MTSRTKPLLVRVLHWLAVLAFVIAIISGYRQADTSWPGTGFPDRDLVNAAHETVGILVTFVMLIWFASRVRGISYFFKLSPFEKALALYHLLLSGLGLLIALLAWAGSSAGNYGQALFGFIPVLDILPFDDPQWAFYLNSLHVELIPYFLFLSGVHAFSALFHLIVLRDGVFSAMWFQKGRR